jgi:hypothetical protein
MRWTVGTTITGQGRVVQRDVTRQGLHRMRVEALDRYPDLEIWSHALGKARLLLHDYSERQAAGRVMICTLFLYWKE